MNNIKLSLGYLTINSRENYFRGAALVTDSRGIPTDFRYTEPVCPTKLERVLYGSALDIYLREDIILDNLLDAVEAKPSMWLLTDETLIAPVQKISRLPAVVIGASARFPLEYSGQCEPTGESGVFMFQADNISAPLRLTVSPENIARINQLTQMLTSAAECMELMEPFSRVERALDTVSESESKQ
ncbi:MAG: hypothetical protein LBE65_03215 [Synergistaceae bacterium]|jgi:hypothetical protein|nr:hypothetical protein [Synergistaceae bacterium]